MRGHTHRVITRTPYHYRVVRVLDAEARLVQEGDGISTPSLPYTTAHVPHKTDKGTISEGPDIVESFIARAS